MPWSPLHVTPGAHDGLHSRNPWMDISGHSSSPGADPDANFSATQSIRRRGTSYHVRLQTTAGDPLCSTSDSSDESEDGKERRGASLDLHETCPSLKRAISTGRKTFDTARPVDIYGGCPTGLDGNSTTQTETEVIIHQIQPGDSLPGVALKYSVSLATLRKANKLWANDTIHLRQVLYIPLHAVTSGRTSTAEHAPRGRPECLSRPIHQGPEVHARTFPRLHRSSSSHWNTVVNSGTMQDDSAAPHTISAGRTSATIKRVPLSELSFFPPSSTSSLSSSVQPKSLSPIPIPKSNNAVVPPSSFANFSTRGTSTFGLANLLNGAKGEIISRLSFDSTRGSSEAASEEQHDMELDIVQPRGRARRGSSITDEDGEEEWTPQFNGAAYAMNSIGEQESVILNTPRKPKVIRTVQLQPSPKMVIPASS